MKKIMLIILTGVAILSQPLVSLAEQAPDVTLQTDKQSFKLSDKKGQVIYLDFWASWCVPCRKSFPWMNQAQKKFSAQGFQVIAVNLDENRQQASAFLSKYPASFTVAYDPQGKLASIYSIKGMPSSFLIDRKGNIRKTHIGFRADDPAELEAEIRSLLKQ